MTFTQRLAGRIEVAIVCVGLVVPGAAAQKPSQPRSVAIPGTAQDRLSVPGAPTYLSAGLGRYIRLTRLYDRIAYVEHANHSFGRVRWWGELRIVPGGRPGR